MACYLGALYFMLPERSSNWRPTNWACSFAMTQAERPVCLWHRLASPREPLSQCTRLCEQIGARTGGKLERRSSVWQASKAEGVISRGRNDVQGTRAHFERRGCCRNAFGVLMGVYKGSASACHKHVKHQFCLASA